jgi:transaldolase / glucose-6-phosphate isomerase
MSKSASPLRELGLLGQSVWLDYIRRDLLPSPEFRSLIENDGLDGMTSNPTIFEKAIGGSSAYDEQFHQLVAAGDNVEGIYEGLTTMDIKTAADTLRPIYDRTEGRTGYVSYEVSPLLANETDATLAAARRYHKLIDRPNLMIKVPARPAGVRAFEQLISEGMNINVTLMFSVAHYEAIANAYIRGLERRAQAGNPIDRVASVASVFVSRVETLADKRLDDKLKARADEAIAALRGTAAVAGTRLIYQRFKEIFSSDRFKALEAKGARVQRPLWASTGTKNPAYSDIKYVQELIGPDTVNTMPPATMDAYRDHGEPRATLEQDLAGARDIVKRLAAVGIDLNELGEELQKEGVDSFDKSFIDLLGVIKGRRDAIVAASLNHQKIGAAAWQKQIDDCYRQLDKEEFPSRLWRKDARLWKKESAHQAIISNALGWLAVPELMAAQAASLREFAEGVRKDGFRDIVLLGMGGSSLCPEVLARTYYSEPGFPHLHVLDSTVPAQLEALEKRIDVAQTLFVVSTKSGGTIETLSHCAYFFDRVKARKGVMAGRSFVAITDPGTNLEKLAANNGFRHTFLNPHDIGGRYSALSYFGLVPAALIGLDVDALLDRARRMQHSSAGSIRVEKNSGVSLGAALGTLLRAGRDKVTFIISPPIGTFGLWVEQLIAESTGKEGTGLIPISEEPVGAPGDYGDDRIFTYLRLNNGFDPAQDSAVDDLEKSGAPVVRIAVEDKLGLAEEFMRWEIATATAGSILRIDAFDQPNVQESKDNTGRLLKEFERTAKLPGDPPASHLGNLTLYCPATVKDAIGAAGDFDNSLKGFLKLAKPNDYFAIMAYVTPGTTVEREIARMRLAVRNRLKIATTFGYGPRFLHSTGQLHKGGPNTGLFLQITQDHLDNPKIPGAPYGFATLNEAQYLGDYESLQHHGRRIIRVHLHGDAEAGLIALRHAIEAAVA